MNQYNSESPNRILEDFYSIYGWTDEIPPITIDPSGSPILFSSVYNSAVFDEVSLLESLLNDQELIELTDDCRSLVWEIANLGSDIKLLEEIERNLHILKFDKSQLLLGLQLYAQASGSDPRSETDWDPVLKGSLAEGAISKAYAETMEIIGSTILKIYVAMVYLRGDIMMSALRKLDEDFAPRLILIKKLFSHELIRASNNPP